MTYCDSVDSVAILGSLGDLSLGLRLSEGIGASGQAACAPFCVQAPGNAAAVSEPGTPINVCRCWTLAVL